jgi:hypothetical protein
MRKKISNRWRKNRFMFLPRKWRKLQLIRLKNQIHRAAPVLGGKFMTHDYIHGQNGWVDVYFLSLNGRCFYNATLSTSRYEYAEKIWQVALERSYLLAPDTDPGWFSRGSRDPKTGHYVIPARPPEYFEALDGMTRFDEIDAWRGVSNAIVEPWDWPA